MIFRLIVWMICIHVWRSFIWRPLHIVDRGMYIALNTVLLTGGSRFSTLNFSEGWLVSIIKIKLGVPQALKNSIYFLFWHPIPKLKESAGPSIIFPYRFLKSSVSYIAYWLTFWATIQVRYWFLHSVGNILAVISPEYHLYTWKSAACSKLCGHVAVPMDTTFGGCYIIILFRIGIRSVVGVPRLSG